MRSGIDIPCRNSEKCGGGRRTLVSKLLGLGARFKRKGEGKRRGDRELFKDAHGETNHLTNARIRGRIGGEGFGRNFGLEVEGRWSDRWVPLSGFSLFLFLIFYFLNNF